MQSIEQAFVALRGERPVLVQKLRLLMDAAQPADKPVWECLLVELAALQAAVMDKRELASDMLRVQPSLTNHHALRHVPDVMIRKLCQIADIPRRSNASDEWLDKMEARDIEATKGQ